MKKIHILGAAFMAIALNMGVASCGSDNNDIDAPITGEEIDKTDQTIKSMPATFIEAVKDIDQTGTITVLDAPLSDLFVMDNGKIIGRLSQKSQAHTRAGEKEFAEGTYRVNPDGSLTATIEGYSITISAEKKSVIINSTEYAAEVTAAKVTNEANATLCRTWYPTEYNTVIYAGQKAIGNYKSASILSLQSIVSAAIGTDVKLLSGEVDKISFLGNNTIITNYKGDNYQVATWSWTDESKGELKASFSSVDENLMAVPGFTRFQTGTPNTCFLVSSFQIQATGKDKVPFMADMKVIIKMKDAK